MAKTLVVLINLRLTTDLQENGQNVFSPPRDEKSRKPVQKSYEHMYRVYKQVLGVFKVTFLEPIFQGLAETSGSHFPQIMKSVTDCKSSQKENFSVNVGR